MIETSKLQVRISIASNEKLEDYRKKHPEHKNKDDAVDAFIQNAEFNKED